MFRKLVSKCILFFLLFCLLFFGAQEILKYKFGENLEDKYQAYMEEPENSIDVAFIGSSTTQVCAAPPVMWKECGFTAYNFGLSRSSSLISYYQLRFLLEVKMQKPKLIVFGFTCIADSDKADDTVKFENSHRKAVEAMPFLNLKSEMIFQIKKDNPKQNIFTYFFPLLRYHSRWSDITEDDFLPDEYYECTKGVYYVTRNSEEPVNCNAELFEADLEPMPASEYSLNYYRKIVDLCMENGIEMAVVYYPRENEQKTVRACKTLEAFCTENKIHFYDLSTPENWEAVGINGETDFYNLNHLNSRGATKVSLALAHLLQDDFDLPDHRDDPAYSSWFEDWDEFYEINRDILSEFSF